MGKPVVSGQGTQAPPAYRDGPEGDDAVSMHTTRSDYEYDDVPELPSYSDSVNVEDDAERPSPAAASADEYRVVRAPGKLRDGNKSSNSCKTAAASIGSETTIRMDARLNDPYELERYVDEYLAVVPPRPHCRIQGWHWETRKKDNKKEQERVYDFDIVFSLQRYLPSKNPNWWIPTVASNSSSVHRGSFRKTRAPGHKQDIEVGSETPSMTLGEWCQDFCASKSALKIFRVSREVTGLDTNHISNAIEVIVRSTHYRGHLDVSFPVADKNVDIYTPHWVNQARISWVRWIFYLTFLWLITSPILFFATKRWNIYNVEWRWSHVEVDHNGTCVKHVHQLSEEDWVRRYGNLIKSLVWERFQGDATHLPTDVDAEANRRRSERTPSTGNANVDSAVSFIRGGADLWNSVNGRGGRSTDGGWGADS